MFADVTSLRYWKTERADLTTCEDALRADARLGLFCVADGAGSTLFSNIWADILVEQYQQDPLLSSDPFEMEWWIRQAQKLYRGLAPKSEKLDWNARQKAQEQGAYSTLATLHVTHVEEQIALAEALVIGDSCVLVGNSQKQQVTSFPLHHPQDFDRAPYCVPSLLRNLNRYTLYPKTWNLSLTPGDIVILATDAVAHWIISGGGSGNEGDAWKAFLEVAQKTERDWPEFIDDCRANRLMVDDDSTVIIIYLREDGRGEMTLGTPLWPRPEILAVRSAEFQKAQKEDNKEMLAILYGDGRMLKTANIVLPDEDMIKAHEVANALREVLQAIRDAVNTSNFIGKLETAWWQYADLLKNERCAETLRKNLIAQGVRLKRPEKAQLSAQPVHNSPEDALKQAPQAQATTTGKPVQPKLSDHIAAMPENGGSPPQAVSTREVSHLPVGNDPERTRILRRSEFAPALQQHDEMVRLQSFRELLAKGEPYSIAEAYHPSFENSLSEEEQMRLQAILSDVNHLLTVLNEGTALQKIEAYETLRQPPFEGDNLKQLEMARELTQAMNSGNNDHISDTYSKFEFSPLRKFFIISPEEQRRIKQAQQGRGATERFRMILQSGAATPELILQAYQQILASGSTLTNDEHYIVDLLQHFITAYQGSQQALQTKDQARLEHFFQLYSTLYYSPYKIALTWDEERQVNAARSYANPFNPAIVMVNKIAINLSDALALLNVKRRYVRSRLAYFRQQRPKEPFDEKVNQDLIAHWEKQLEQRDWPATILNDLIDWRLLQQKVQEEINAGNARRGNSDLKKDLHKYLEELAGEMRTYKDPERENEEIAREFQAAGSEFRASIARLTEQNFRQAQESIALERLVKRYLLEMSEGFKIADWLEALRNGAAVYYYERPVRESPLTLVQQRSWIFKWWVVQDRKHTILK